MSKRSIGANRQGKFEECPWCPWDMACICACHELDRMSVLCGPDDSTHADRVKVGRFARRLRRERKTV